ncbi:MAG: choice-of-anchor A family protein, partial [Gemmatimonadales bacterium]
MLVKLVRAALAVSVLGVGAAACGGGGGDSGGTGPGPGPGPTTADLAITVTDGATVVGDGASLTYTIVVSNNGPDAVTGARVSDTFPVQLTGESWTCTASAGSSCPASGAGTIAADVSLRAAGTATFSATGTVSGAGTLVNTAVVTAPAGV